jgi:hypothetical protein
MSATDLSDMLKGTKSQKNNVNKKNMIPPLAATYVNRLDNKQGVQKPGNVTKYALLPFTSSARSDGLVLKHWRRVKTAKGADYEFAKFNNSTRMVVYTMVEWDTLKLESAETLNGKVWTKEETDYLLYLCHHFGLRWPVIADRYDYSSSSSSSSPTPMEIDGPNDTNEIDQTSIEALKHRYYSVARLVLSHRYDRDIKTGPAPARVELGAPYNVSILQPGPVEAKLLMSFQYDYTNEINKKNFLLKVFDKTPNEEDEESMLKLELKKIELQIKKLKENKSILNGQQETMEILRGGRKNVASKPTNIRSNGNKSNIVGVGGIGAGYGHSDVGASVLHPARMGPLTADAPVYLRSVRLLSEATPAALLPSTGNANVQADNATNNPPSSNDNDIINTTSIGPKMLSKMNMVS